MFLVMSVCLSVCLSVCSDYNFWTAWCRNYIFWYADTSWPYLGQVWVPRSLGQGQGDMSKNDNFTYFNMWIICIWLQVINEVKVTHQGEGHIKVKVKMSTSFPILCSPYFLQAGGLHSTECILVNGCAQLGCKTDKWRQWEQLKFSQHYATLNLFVNIPSSTSLRILFQNILN